MCHHIPAVFCIFAPARPKISQNYIDLSLVYVSVWSPGLIRARGRNWVWLNKLMTILMRLCQGSRDTCLHREHSKRYHIELLKKIEVLSYGWCRWSFAGHSTWRPVFVLRPASVGFMVDRVTGTGFTAIISVMPCPSSFSIATCLYFIHLKTT